MSLGPDAFSKPTQVAIFEAATLDEGRGKECDIYS